MNELKPEYDDHMKETEIDLLIAELKETWGYETEELNDIRAKITDYGTSCFWEGYEKKSQEINAGLIGFAYGQTYGKKSDNE